MPRVSARAPPLLPGVPAAVRSCVISRVLRKGSRRSALGRGLWRMGRCSRGPRTAAREGSPFSARCWDGEPA
jgi:hypothetical protein